MTWFPNPEPVLKSILFPTGDLARSIRTCPLLDKCFNKRIEYIKDYLLNKKVDGAAICVMSDGHLLGIEIKDGKLKTDSELWIHFRNDEMKNQPEYTCEKIILGWLPD